MPHARVEIIIISKWLSSVMEHLMFTILFVINFNSLSVKMLITSIEAFWKTEVILFYFITWFSFDIFCFCYSTDQCKLEIDAVASHPLLLQVTRLYGIRLVGTVGAIKLRLIEVGENKHYFWWKLARADWFLFHKSGMRRGRSKFSAKYKDK